MNKAPAHVQAQFPEIVAWQPRCRLCKLCRDKPGLGRVVHEEYRRRQELDLGGRGADAIADAVAGTCESHGVKAFDPQNIRRHFGNHVDATLMRKDDEELLGEAQQALHESLGERFEAAVEDLRTSDPDIGAHGKGDNDYFVMWDMARRLMRRIVALDNDPTAFFTQDSRHDMHKLNVWSGMISNAKSVVEALNKMRNSDKLTISILEQHTVRYSQQVAALLSSDLKDVLTELRRVEDPAAKAIARRLSTILAKKIPEVFQAVAVSSMEEVKQRYGLH